MYLCVIPLSSVCLSVTCVCVFPYVTGSPEVCLLYVVCCKYRDKAIDSSRLLTQPIALLRFSLFFHS